MTVSKCPNCKTDLDLVVADKDTSPVKEFKSTLAIKTVVLDAGHGALDPSTGSDSEALTRVYKFPHNGKKVYEGVINRMYTKEIKRQLEKVGIRVLETAPNHIDTPLATRVEMSNREDSKSAYFLSIHCNGSATHTATGAEGYTTRGQNRSDDIMQFILSEMTKYTRTRSDKTDGDLDKEAGYYVIKHTKLRAGLLEIGFYDNWDEYLKLTSEDFIRNISRAITKGIVKYNQWLENQ